MIMLTDDDPTQQQYSWRLLMMQLMRNTLADDDPMQDWKLLMMQMLMDTLADDDPWVTTLDYPSLQKMQEPKQISIPEQHMLLRLIQFSLPNTPAFFFKTNAEDDPKLAPSWKLLIMQLLGNTLADDDPF